MTKFEPSVGDKIEFLSDRQTDKGPCSGKVLAVEGRVLLTYSDTTQWHDPEAIEVDKYIHAQFSRDGRTYWGLR